MLKDLHIALIQSPICWEDKNKSLQVIASLLTQVQPQTHIIILPEMFATGFTMNAVAHAEDMDGEIVNWMKSTALRLRKIICGTVIIKDNHQYYNRLIWMLPNGTYHTYDKYHLFSKAQEHMHYTSGDTKLIVSVNGWKIHVQTCYDLRFPVFSRQTNDLYDVMINVAQWPDMRIKAYDTLLQARAIENQVYVVAVNACGRDGHDVYYSGHSAVYKYDGECLAQVKDEAQVINYSLNYADLQEFRERYPFLDDRDAFLILNKEE